MRVRNAGNLDLWDHYLLYTPEDEQVVVCDLATGEARMVATRPTAKGDLSWGRGSGSAVAYRTLARVPNLDADPTTSWTIHVHDLRTGKRRLVARSRRPVDEEFGFMPTPMIDGRWVVWSQAPSTADPRTGPDVMSFDVVTGKKRLLVSGAGTAEVDVSDGWVFYNGKSGDRRHDLFRVPADGSGPPEQLTTTGNVAFPAVRDGLVVWHEYKSGAPAPPDKQFSVFAWRPPSRSIVPIDRGHPFGKVSSGTVAVFSANSGLIVIDPDHPDHPVLLAPADAFGSFTASDEVVAWVATDDALNKPDDQYIRFARIVR